MRTATGAAPQQVYRRIRLIVARKHVLETVLPVSEIALRCGYQDASAMTRAFKAEFGTTPRALRIALT
jgi:transcriptional regulator GlxA family with amidase domain